ncbi:MAG TPA: sigma factor-like helix-turn-helix DNA-binding protein [Dehalococcoidia bacterium]|jgi:DNA-directed RNA polymerase specialized sigma24 family protein|nr:sigma factor-like helix-turn-helix DNA-binding protein [Dehalococcoidia bacterium]
MRSLRSSGPTAPQIGSRDGLKKERFADYFARLFAYACGATGDDEAARDVAVAAFTEVFAMPDLRESEFELVLFGGARRLCASGEYRLRRHNDGLSPRERDVLSLVFDGKLAGPQIGRLLGIRPETVSATLTRGLRKLQQRLGQASAVPGQPHFA